MDFKTSSKAALTNMSEREQKRSGLQEQISTYLYDTANVVIVMLDREANLLLFNPYAQKLTGYREEEVLGCNWFRRFIPDPHTEKIMKIFRDVVNAKDLHWGQENEILCKDGTTRTIRWQNSRILDKNGKTEKILSVGIDITEEKRAQAEHEKLLKEDPLTGLPNKIFLDDRLQMALNRAQRHKNRVMVAFLDLNDFKSINDTLGHATGDQLIAAVAERLKSNLRKSDTLIRFGGDEFILIAEEIKTLTDAKVVTKKISELFLTPFTIHRSELYITSSIGATLYPDDSQDPKTLLTFADIAMYKAKKSRKSVQFFEPQMHQNLRKRMIMENELREAIKKRSFHLLFQPQVDTLNDRIQGAEALLRWDHPYLGIVPPEHFIPIAEETGMIVELGEWVLEEVVAKLEKWHHMGYYDLKISVNISRIQLYHDRLYATLKRLLSTSKIDPAMLELEFSEKILFQQREWVLSILERIKDLGVQIAIDNFGESYASLRNLQHFPIDHIKINRHFIQNLTRSEKDQAMISAIIHLSRNLGLELIAEGVEEHAQLEYLTKRHCHAIQGFFFSKPLPAETFESFLKSHDKGETAFCTAKQDSLESC